MNVHLDSAPIVVDPIAVCRSDGPAQGSSGTVAVDDFVSYTDGKSTCTVDDAGEIASVEVSGGRFRLDGLRDFGGPRIRLPASARAATPRSPAPARRSSSPACPASRSRQTCRRTT